MGKCKYAIIGLALTLFGCVYDSVMTNPLKILEGRAIKSRYVDGRIMYKYKLGNMPSNGETFTFMSEKQYKVGDTLIID